MPAIDIDGLTKRYDELTAVRDLDLQVHAGEVFGFLGSNGAGKSTTIDVLLDYVRPTSGEVRVFGHDAQEETRAVHARTGFLPDDYDLYDRLTGREHVAFVAEAKGVETDTEAVLKRVGLDDADRAVGDYSKGMTQRLALGLALVGEPDLLVFDEPTAGFDPNAARNLREIVRTEADHGTTVFFSSHRLAQVEAVCDRVGIMESGELVAVDTVSGLRDAAGAGDHLELSVDPTPDEALLADLHAMDDVEHAGLDDDTLVVACDDGAKASVIERVGRFGVLEDVASRTPSLESVFEAYTGERLERNDPALDASETDADGSSRQVVA